MIELSKLKPYMQVATWLAVFFVIVNLTLSALSSTPVLSWLPETVTGAGFIEDSRRRVVQAEEEYRQGRVDAHDRLGVFVGISNLREGIDLSAIRPVIGPQWRLLGVAGAGFGMRDFVDYARLVTDSDLHPDLVILGFGLHQLADAHVRADVVDADNGLFSLLRRGELRTAAVTMRNSLWVYSRRQDVSVTVDTAVLAARSSLMKRFGVPLSKDEIEKLTPWREMVRSDWPEHFSQATLDAQLKFYADRGIFDGATYNDSSNAMSILLGIIDDFRQHHTKTLLVILPESSKLTSLIPGEALEVLNRNLASRFHDEAPPMLDYRQALDASGLVDHVHVNSKGRLELSRRLAADLKTLLPDETSRR